MVPGKPEPEEFAGSAFRGFPQAGGEEPEREKDPHAVALGRKGGLKGGKARAAALTSEQKSEIGRKAVEARWAKRRAAGGGETPSSN